MCILANKKFYATCVKIGNVIFRCRTTLYEVKICSFIYYYKSVLELSCSGSV